MFGRIARLLGTLDDVLEFLILKWFPGSLKRRPLMWLLGAGLTLAGLAAVMIPTVPAPLPEPPRFKLISIEQEKAPATATAGSRASAVLELEDALHCVKVGSIIPFRQGPGIKVTSIEPDEVALLELATGRVITVVAPSLDELISEEAVDAAPLDTKERSRREIHCQVHSVLDCPAFRDDLCTAEHTDIPDLDEDLEVVTQNFTDARKILLHQEPLPARGLLLEESPADFSVVAVAGEKDQYVAVIEYRKETYIVQGGERLPNDRSPEFVVTSVGADRVQAVFAKDLTVVTRTLAPEPAAKAVTENDKAFEAEWNGLDPSKGPAKDDDLDLSDL